MIPPASTCTSCNGVFLSSFDEVDNFASGFRPTARDSSTASGADHAPRTARLGHSGEAGDVDEQHRRRAFDRFPDCDFGIHVHDRMGLAPANLVAALDAGVTMVEGSMMLEDNEGITRITGAMGMHHYKTWRIYDMEL